MTQTQTPNRPEHGDRIYTISGASPRFTIRRHLAGYAYPANGNVHNPTPRYEWDLLLDGRYVDFASKQGTLVARAREAGAVEAYSA